GRTNCCAKMCVIGVHTDGGMRDLIVVPAHKLHRSATLTLDQLALVETLGIGAHAVDRAAIEPGEWALVIGAGPIGLATMQFAQAAGGRVIALDVNPVRLSFCREKLHVAEAVFAGEAAADQIRAITGGDLPTAVFDATGNAASMMGAFHFAASGARVVYVGLVLSDITFYDPDFHRKEISLLATRNARAADFKRIIALMESGEIETTPWITHRAEACDLPAEFPGWLEPESGVLKAVVSF
ncbi:MAG TPA: zinc-binding dehydrogenase, partial [Chthonomonadaceae bacterium]|nr:zinc-binding dehydrogenase [Chthonomonadaceae bacterium]